MSDIRVSAKTAKNMANRARKHLSGKFDLTHSQALELTAAMFGHKNWNVMRASIERCKTQHYKVEIIKNMPDKYLEYRGISTTVSMYILPRCIVNDSIPVWLDLALDGWYDTGENILVMDSMCLKSYGEESDFYTVLSSTSIPFTYMCIDRANHNDVSIYCTIRLPEDLKNENELLRRDRLLMERVYFPEEEDSHMIDLSLEFVRSILEEANISVEAIFPWICKVFLDERFRVRYDRFVEICKHGDFEVKNLPCILAAAKVDDDKAIALYVDANNEIVWGPSEIPSARLRGSIGRQHTNLESSPNKYFLEGESMWRGRGKTIIAGTRFADAIFRSHGIDVDPLPF